MVGSERRDGHFVVVISSPVVAASGRRYFRVETRCSCGDTRRHSSKKAGGRYARIHASRFPVFEALFTVVE